MSPAENRALREMGETLHDLDVRVAVIQAAIEGDGTKGLAERVNEHEDWIKARPQECPMVVKRKGAIGRKALEVSIIAVALTALQLVLKLVGVL